MVLSLHVVAGLLGLASGAVALVAFKGGPLHRRAGLAFVVTMLTMALVGAALSVWFGIARGINVPAGLITAYLVVTGFAAVRPPAGGARALTMASMLVALTVGAVCLGLGFAALAAGGSWDRIPAPAYFMFAVFGLAGGWGDVKVLRSGPLAGPRRLARHLWRMCIALFIACFSFFLGQAQTIPEPLRIDALLPLPGLAVLATMIYWLRRLRRRGVEGRAAFSAADPSGLAHPAAHRPPARS